MAKSIIHYICSNCGYESPKWLGKCPNCNSWNSFEEQIIKPASKSKLSQNNAGKKKNLPPVANINNIKIERTNRIKTNINELDRVLGGGIIPGSVILIGGEPGIGKSTLLLQTANAAAVNSNKVLYISGEESAEQIKHRADRLKINNSNLLVLAETDLSVILDYILSIKPAITIIDSIQTMYNPEIENTAGSVVQIRNCTANLLDIAKKGKIAMFLVGHITKGGTIAGPKLLEHIVDVVLHMAGEKFHPFRIIQSNKNRFGSTSEIGVFEMFEEGLKEVNNASQYFLSEHKEKLPGSVISTVMEGSRTILLEIQALVVPSNYPYPKRVIEGIDYNKAYIITAIIEKILGIKLFNQEIYVKVVGGLKVNEPSIDLGIAFAILSSIKSTYINDIVAIGEIGLTGEIRPVPFINQRLNEIVKAGISNAVVPAYNKNNINKNIASKLNIKFISNIHEIKIFFNNRRKS